MTRLVVEVRSLVLLASDEAALHEDTPPPMGARQVRMVRALASLVASASFLSHAPPST